MMRTAAIAICMVLLASSAAVGADETPLLGYEELIEKIESGEVSSVVLTDGRSIRGVLSTDEQRRSFLCIYPDESMSDPLLARLLKEHNVSVAQAPSEEAGGKTLFALSCAMLAVPVVTLILLLSVSGRLKRIERRLGPGASPF